MKAKGSDLGFKREVIRYRRPASCWKQVCLSYSFGSASSNTAGHSLFSRGRGHLGAVEEVFWKH